MVKYEQQTLPYQKHSPTSKAAAESISDNKRIIDQLKIFEAIRDSHDGLTDEQGQSLTGINGNTYRPRRGELQKMGYLYPEGIRNTKSGRKAAVWYVR